MSLRNYTQSAWVVHDIEDAIKRWKALGAGPFFMTNSDDLPDREYRGQKGRDNFVAAHAFLGQAQIELIQPTTDEPSIFREVLDRKGEVLHHMQHNCGALDAAGFDARAQKYRDMGLEMVHLLVVPNVARIVFFDAQRLMGFYIELAERPSFVLQNTLKMYEAHLAEEDRKYILREKVRLGYL